MLAYYVKDGKDQDADEFLGFYLDALDEELIELNDYINTRKILNIEEPGEGEDQTDVRKRGCSVCRLFLFSLLRLIYVWKRIGGFIRVAHLAHIRWKVPFDRTRAKPA